MTAHVPGATRPLSTGDIVSFRFPHFDGPGKKDRPCLVIHVDDATGEAVLAYGTSIFPKDRDDYSLTVMNAVNMAVANLVKPTRFLSVRHVRVKRSDQRFAPNAEGNVVIGRFPAEGIRWGQRYSKLPVKTPDEERQGIHPPKAQRSQEQRGLFGRSKPRAAMIA
ncbi:hypothetical protein PhaeoP18_01797 [Phaeobacter piscinae]|uniref:PemK-like protein n=2 Tax=Phaeobacter piscinae TaxID=1580596 RepID=A0AAN1LAM7_9RHOB|nr:hypothetical protein PhaeoP13_01821 [Phaeobacter piscinae]AUR36066.1 hypothetical protein PhaeoP18_01797 [Phaeobacter piscinae]